MKYIILIATLLCTLFPALSQSLKISENKHYLVKEDGTPFFWLGDTAWELFHRLNREEATRYLQNRADKDFTVIQAVVLAELEGLNTPNPYGETPLVDNDPAQPNEAYFEHVDFIVNKAEELGLIIGMLPTWGDKFNKKWGVGPEVFTPENARVFGEFLGNRYKDEPIIWILGGDRNPEEEEDFAIIRAMAEGLAAGDEGAHLMTYHPQGDFNSAEFFHDDEWIDFNMFQSGHGSRNKANYRWTLANRKRTPTKPTLDGEPAYEDHPIDWKPANGWFDEYDVRKNAYWSMLAGALGHTYGDHNIWQMWQPGREPISSARTPWQKALDYPGAFQMGYMRQLFESRPFTTLVPDSTLVVSAQGNGHVQAARGEGFMMVYLPQHAQVTVDAAKLSGKKMNAWWFDPRSGDSVRIGELKRTHRRTSKTLDPSSGASVKSMELKKTNQHTFKTPDAEKDWVLVVDDASKDFPAPGEYTALEKN